MPGGFDPWRPAPTVIAHDRLARALSRLTS